MVCSKGGEEKEAEREVDEEDTAANAILKFSRWFVCINVCNVMSRDGDLEV